MTWEALMSRRSNWDLFCVFFFPFFSVASMTLKLELIFKDVSSLVCNCNYHQHTLFQKSWVFQVFSLLFMLKANSGRCVVSMWCLCSPGWAIEIGWMLCHVQNPAHIKAFLSPCRPFLSVSPVLRSKAIHHHSPRQLWASLQAK